MENRTAEVVICGAGIAGVSAAYHLSVEHGVRDIVLVDERPPLSLTSQKSTECYRNWWPGPGDGMVRLMNRSIDKLEAWAQASGNPFHLNRRGYLFATAQPERIPIFKTAAEEAASLGAGDLRVHSGNESEHAYQPAPNRGFEDLPDGADLILDQELIRGHFPYLHEDTLAVLHPRRCGWLSAQQLGVYMLDAARRQGVRVEEGRVVGIGLAADRVESIRVQTKEGSHVLSAPVFVNAAGPMQKEVAGFIGVDLPIYCELHASVAFPDHLRVLPRAAPLLIWTDPVRLPWSEEEKVLLAEEGPQWLLDEFPGGVHARPDGPEDSPIVLILWTYHTDELEPRFPPPFEETFYPEIALRGMSRMVPGLASYFGRLPRPVVDGGYYARTRENRPLIGPLPVEGAYLIGALSGFGIMASPAAGELLAAHIVGADLPGYAHWFGFERYEDPSYQALLEDWESDGQL